MIKKVLYFICNKRVDEDWVNVLLVLAILILIFLGYWFEGLFKGL